MGFITGILAGIFTSLQNSQFRKLPEITNLALNGIRFAANIPILALLVTLFGIWQVPPTPFFIILLASLPLEIAIAFCYVRAFQLSPQSLVGPLFSMSVVFLVPLSYFLVGDTPSVLGLIGITLSLTGTLALGWNLKRPQIKSILRNIFKEKGSYYILTAALLAAGTVTLAKLSYRYIPPLLSAFYLVSGLTMVYLPFAMKVGLKTINQRKKDLTLMSVADAFVNVFHYIGLSLLPAAYFISLKRSSVLFDVLFGKFVHHENHFKTRLIGATLMVGGIILISLA